DNTDWIELPPGLFRGLSAASVAVWVRDLSTARQGGRLFHFSAGPDEEIYFAPDDVDPDTSTPGSHLAGRHRGSSFVDLWTTSPILTDKEWHHVVVTWNSASLDLYVDGARRGSVDSPEALPSDLGDTGPDYLGRSLDEAQIALYAEMDDLRVYARALDAGEVAQLFTEP
ncbi:MAG TPA: LamG domain-containing protein, partial [Polyangiaceae bacterium]